MSKYKEKLDNMVYSFSRIHCYETCPYQFYKKYIEEDKSEESNYYADNGKLMHAIFERLLKKKITLDEAVVMYEDEYADIDFCYDDVRQKIKDQCYESSMEYLTTADEFDFSPYEILGIEKKVKFNIGPHKFIGIIDLLLRDKASQEIIILDHKSSTGKIFKKDGSILKSQAENFTSYKRQLYLYATGVKDEFGVFPTFLVWHHFRENGALTKIRFDQQEYDETIKWAADLIDRIYFDEEFEPTQSYMPCHVLCGYRNSCEYLDEV